MIPIEDFRFFETESARSENSDRVSLAVQAETVREYEHGYPAYVPVLKDAGRYYYNQEVVELARAVVPFGTFGSLIRIDTAIIDGTTGETGPDNNPIEWSDRFRFFLLANGFFDSTVRNRRLFGNSLFTNYSFYQAGSGVPFSPFCFWEDNRYSWNSASNAIAMPIPAGSFVRLFAQAKQNLFFPHQIQGRLRWNQQYPGRNAVRRWQA